MFEYININISSKYKKLDSYFFIKNIEEYEVDEEQKKYLGKMKNFDTQLKIELENIIENTPKDHINNLYLKSQNVYSFIIKISIFFTIGNNLI